MSTLTIRTVPVTRQADEQRRPSLIGRFFAFIAQEVRVQRDLRRLYLLDARALHDIGIAGGALEDAVRHGRPTGYPVGTVAAFEAQSLPRSTHTEWR